MVALFSGSSLFKPAAKMNTEAIAPRTILYTVALHYAATIYDAVLEFNVPSAIHVRVETRVPISVN